MGRTFGGHKIVSMPWHCQARIYPACLFSVDYIVDGVGLGPHLILYELECHCVRCGKWCTVRRIGVQCCALSLATATSNDCDFGGALAFRTPVLLRFASSANFTQQRRLAFLDLYFTLESVEEYHM